MIFFKLLKLNIYPFKKISSFDDVWDSEIEGSAIISWIILYERNADFFHDLMRWKLASEFHTICVSLDFVVLEVSSVSFDSVVLEVYYSV